MCQLPGCLPHRLHEGAPATLGAQLQAQAARLTETAYMHMTVLQQAWSWLLREGMPLLGGQQALLSTGGAGCSQLSSMAAGCQSLHAWHVTVCDMARQVARSPDAALHWVSRLRQACACARVQGYCLAASVAAAGLCDHHGSPAAAHNPGGIQYAVKSTV
jgi:hypothetical protein